MVFSCGINTLRENPSLIAVSYPPTKTPIQQVETSIAMSGSKSAPLSALSGILELEPPLVTQRVDRD